MHIMATKTLKRSSDNPNVKLPDIAKPRPPNDMGNGRGGFHAAGEPQGHTVKRGARPGRRKSARR
jgi:hypothetical protein